jgi:UDP-N-acetylglucosamine:LPS N-acetylglucosamine transferase
VKVKLVKKLPRGYLGLNKYAARELGLRFPYPANVVLVKKTLSPLKRIKTAIHERIEAYHMRRGLSYRKAHRIASALEKKVKVKVKK